jgi:Fe-S-cluster-containing hydrogenase component 2
MNERPVAHIDQSICDGCSSCTVGSICPKDAVVPDSLGIAAVPAARRSRNPLKNLLGEHGHHVLGEHGPHAWKVEESKCSGCLLCAPYCPQKAVVARERGKAA